MEGEDRLTESEEDANREIGALEEDPAEGERGIS